MFDPYIGTDVKSLVMYPSICNPVTLGAFLTTIVLNLIAGAVKPSKGNIAFPESVPIHLNPDTGTSLDWLSSMKKNVKGDNSKSMKVRVICQGR